jgi:hypothetical protein
MDWQVQAGLLLAYLILLTLVPLDFFSWRYIKDAVYVPQLATTFLELAGVRRAAVATVTY